MDTSHTAPPASGATPLGATLRRTTEDRLLLGLCGGIARSADLSPVVVRLATVVFSFVLLPFVVAAYLATALIVPRDDGTALLGQGERDSRDVVVVLLFLAVAAPLILGTASTGIFGGLDAWPAVLAGSILLFALAIWRPKALFDRRTPAPTAGTGGVTFTKTSATVAAPPSFDDPFSGTVTGPYPSDVLTPVERGASTDEGDPGAPRGGGSGDGSGDGPETPTFVREPEPPARPARRRSIALPIFAILAVIPALFVVTVVLGIVDGVWNAWAVMLALMAVGAAGGGVAIAFVRRSYLGTGFLVMLAAVLGGASIALNQLGPLVDDGVGTRVATPATLGELRPNYVLGLGEFNLDLRQLRLKPDSTTTVGVKVGYGQIRVIVPKGVRVVAAPGSQVPELAATAGANGASAKTSAHAPVVALDVRVKGGEADLLTGASRYSSNLEVLSSVTHGFWGTNDDTQDARPPVNQP